MDTIKTGCLIKEIRKERNMTQQQLAEEIHVSVPAISKWENGHGFPDVALLVPLASALGISVAELINGERCYPEKNKPVDQTVSKVIQLSENQKKKEKMTVIAITAAVMLALMVSLVFLFRDVGAIRDYFSPRVTAAVYNSEPSDEWQRVLFDGTEYLNFDSRFFSKVCTNDGNSDGKVELRFSDADGNAIIENVTIGAGESAQLTELKGSTDYAVDIKCGSGWYVINFH